MTLWNLSITAEDGTHNHVHKSYGAAIDALCAQLGIDMDIEIDDDPRWRDEPLRANRRYTDDYGRRLVIERMPSGITTAKQLDRLGEAYDARECGIATKAQLALLARANY